MFVIPILSIFTLLVANSDSAAIVASAIPSNSTSTDIGKCDNLVSELVFQLEADNGISNATELCKKVSQCYGTLKEGTAQALKKIYDFRCEKYEFYKNDMMYCNHRILQDRDWGSSYYCPNMLTLTTKDFALKKTAFKSSKSCILEVAKEKCSTESLNYLTENYEKFVDYLTNPSENDSCESLNAELNQQQCSFIRETAIDMWWMMEYYEKEYNELPGVNIVKSCKLCDKLEECHQDKCNILSTVKPMKNCEVYRAVIKSFYNCLKVYGKVHPVSMGDCTENDRECIRNATIAKCGDDVTEDFDKYYDWFNKNNVDNLKALKIHGNFSQFLVEDSLQNAVSINSELGKCVPLVEQLVTLLSRYTVDNPRKHVRLEIEKCQSITDCYGSIASDESARLKNSYQAVCDKLELKLNEKH